MQSGHGTGHFRGHRALGMITVLEPLIAESSRHATKIVGTGDRQARRVVSSPVEKGMLTSENPRAPLRLAFPAALAGRWLPGLSPDKPE